MRNTKPHKNSPLLLIGGLDPSGHAGILADSRVLNAYRIPHYAVSTAITAQSRNKFFAWGPVDLNLFKKQLNSIQEKISGVKIGMLGTLAHAKILTAWLKVKKPSFVLWDPILVSSSGAKLLKAKNWNPTLENLLNHTDLIIPNLPEAEWILKRKIKSPRDLKLAAMDLQKLSRIKKGAVLLKGGHLKGKPSNGRVYDFFSKNTQTRLFSTGRRRKISRGTGCTLGAAILAQTHRGKPLPEAIRAARRYVLRRLFHTPTP